MQDNRRFHKAFYDNASKVEQDNFIPKHTAQNIPKGRGPRNGTRNNAVSLKYFIKTRTFNDL
jgi:hypothetical protein